MDGKRYELRILPMFEDDLNEIVDYILGRLKNPIAAEHFVDAVETAIHKRLECPEAFEPYRSVRARKYAYYYIPVKNFMIYYVVIGTCMEVRRIVYSRRNIEQII